MSSTAILLSCLFESKKRHILKYLLICTFIHVLRPSKIIVLVDLALLSFTYMYFGIGVVYVDWAFYTVIL
jgi:hypothetical protein